MSDRWGPEYIEGIWDDDSCTWTDGGTRMTDCGHGWGPDELLWLTMDPPPTMTHCAWCGREIETVVSQVSQVSHYMVLEGR